MRRRTFLGLTAAGAVAMAVPATGRSIISRVDAAALAEPELLDFLGGGAGVRRLGEHYRRDHPLEDDVAVLRARIVEAIPHEVGDVRIGLRRAIQSDFASGRTVQVDGWVLSRTEARQCGLFALTRV